MLGSLFLLLAFLEYVVAYEIVVAINCGSYDRTMVSSKYINYTGDTYFEGIVSSAITKEKLPESITNLADRQILRTSRTLNQGYKTFTYMPIVNSHGHHVILFTFIETEFRAKNQRVFNIKLGDDIIHTVDIFAEAGYGKILHKWSQFTIRDDIIYLNGTLPLLNAYNFRSHQPKITFEGVIGPAKVQAIIVIKGSDATPYLYRFLQYEHEKNVVKKEYISDKYRRIPKLPYRYLQGDDLIKDPPSQLQKFMRKYISLRSLGCILCALFAIHSDKVIGMLQKRVYLRREQNKQKKE